MSKPPLIFILVLAIIAVLATRQFIRQRREGLINDASPERSLQAEVRTKREFPAPNRRSRQREVIAGEAMRYEVLFRPLNGVSDISVQVQERQYHQLDKGARGELTLQGTRFIRFTPLP